MTAPLAAAVWGLNRIYYIRQPLLREFSESSGAKKTAYRGVLCRGSESYLGRSGIAPMEVFVLKKGSHAGSQVSSPHTSTAWLAEL
jgi:hypothetical protein